MVLASRRRLEDGASLGFARAIWLRQSRANPFSPARGEKHRGKRTYGETRIFPAPRSAVVSAPTHRTFAPLGGEKAGPGAATAATFGPAREGTLREKAGAAWGPKRKRRAGARLPQ